MAEPSLKQVWEQKELPVALRRIRKGQRLRVRLPYADSNRQWLQHGRRITPEWFASEKYWELPKTWFNDFVEQALARYRRLYVIQPYRPQETCSPACLTAVGHECECSCMGRNHGVGNDGSWFEVSETFASRWGSEHLACRLMIAK